MKKIALYFLFLLIVQSSCKTVFQAADGNWAFESKQYAVAIEMLLEDYKKTSNQELRNSIAKKLAISYDNINRPDRASFYYEIAMKAYNDPDLHFKYGAMLKKTEDYGKALTFYNKYLLNNPIDRNRIIKEINACKKALKWKKKTVTFQVKEAENINTQYSDYAPVVYNNDFLVFTSARKEATGEDNYGWTGENFSDIFISTIKSGSNQFTDPVKFKGDINSIYNEGTASFTKDNKTMYFTKCGSSSEKNDYCQIFVSKFKNGNWSSPEQVDLGFDFVNVSHPCITNNGKRLYFACDDISGFGYKDIYVSSFRKGEWTKPRNLGPEINTDGYEGYPFLYDGYLYFASDGHLGMGGLDIFRAKLINNRLQKAENLQVPINSGADDFGIYFYKQNKIAELDENTINGFVSSTRKGGKGNDDIYAFEVDAAEMEGKTDSKPSLESLLEQKNELIYLLKGRLITNIYEDPDDPNSKVIRTESIPDAPVEIYGLKSKSNISERLITDSEGKFELVIEGNSEYQISASFPGYFKRSKVISSANKQVKENKLIIVQTEMLIDQLFDDIEVIIDNVKYIDNKSELTTEAEFALDDIAVLLFENPEIKMEIGAHTDSRGSDRYNLKRSEERALKAMQYIISRGVKPNRLSYKGYGENYLINNCSDGKECSEKQHQLNNRTTFKVRSLK